MNYKTLWHRLAKVYGEGEAQAIARLIYEQRYGLTLSDILMGRDSTVPADELEQMARRLEQQEPIQYILGQAEFCGRIFAVNEHVLIPRRETEELCQRIISNIRQETTADCSESSTDKPHPQILDIGTGSGCIAITLAANMPHSIVTAWDISEDALVIARKNAENLGVDINFENVNILQIPNSQPQTANNYSLIVSNPPYICYKERADMEKNVLDYEPPTALFVPDDDPLLFYKAIARFAGKALTPDGMLAVEINRAYGQETCEVLKNAGFNDIQLYQDSYHNDRFVIAKK